MQILRTYARVLGQLKPEKGLALSMTVANVLLAAAQFAGAAAVRAHHRHALTRAQIHGGRDPFTTPRSRRSSWPGWRSGCSTSRQGMTVSLYADKTDSRIEDGWPSMANYFEHRAVTCRLRFTGARTRAA